MTNCEHVQALLSAFLDGEVSDDQSAVISEHLSRCEDCRREWDALASLEDQLRSALAIDDINDKVGAIRRAAANVHPVSGSTSSGKWAILVAALAVSFLAALLSLRHDPDASQAGGSASVASGDPAIIATLVRSTGAVQVLQPGEKNWNSIDQSDQATIAKGARLRTDASVLCEVFTSEECKIRLNEAGEVVFRDATEIELIKGQLWCRAPENSGIEIDISINNTSSPPAESKLVASMRCPSSSEFQCSAGDDAATCDSVSLQNEQTQITVGTRDCMVSPGETVSIDANHAVERRPAVESAGKVWQLPLLAVGNSADPELIDAMTVLLAPIGKTKAMHLHEEQIRLLGPAGAIPLLAYAAHEQEPTQLNLRRTAVMLARELADERSRGMLERLTADPDPYISEQAKVALARIAEL